MKKLILLATAIAVATPVLPLDAQQTVRVTGSSRVDRDSYDKYYDDDQSAIGLTRTADYFVKPIYVNSDSREREVRSQEVDAMLTAMIAKAQEEGITLVAGKYTLSPLTQSSRKDLLTYGRGNRPDTTRVRLFARLPVGGKFSGVDEVDEAILAFYKSIPATGRSYVETGGTELAIDNPRLDDVSSSHSKHVPTGGRYPELFVDWCPSLFWQAPEISRVNNTGLGAASGRRYRILHILALLDLCPHSFFNQLRTSTTPFRRRKNRE